jgi:cytochrome c556
MKKLFATLLGASLVSLLAACGGGGPAGPTIPDTPEGRAFDFRTGVMKSVQWKLTQIGNMAEGEIPADDAAFRKHTADLAVLAGMAPEGFIPNSAVEGSAALPAIWMNMSDFQAKARDFQNAAQALATAAQQSGFEGAKGMVGAVRQTCGGCHRPYRRRAAAAE